MDTEYKINKGQISAIHALLNKMGKSGDKEFKADLVRQFTEGRETSTTKLSWKEAKDMIVSLTKITEPKQDAADKKRKLLIAYAHQMRWENDTGAVDMERVDNWCIKYGQYHKDLMSHDVAELSHLIVQMEKAFRHLLKSV